MAIIDRAFSIHDDALQFRSRRSSVLAANIANADTPNYKARDMDFAAMMENAKSSHARFEMARTHQNHLEMSGQAGDDLVLYRNPLQASLDGNTVDMPSEQARFSENALQYQTSMTFLNNPSVNIVIPTSTLRSCGEHVAGRANCGGT